MIGESEDLATSLLSDADMNHDSKIDLDGKKKTIWKIYYLVIPITYRLYSLYNYDGFSEFIFSMSWI